MILFINKIITSVPLLKRLYPSILTSFFILTNKNIFTIKFENIFMKINILDPIDKEIFFKNTYEKKQIKILVDNIKCYKNAIFVDIGANKGIYSLTLAKKFKNLKIYAYEPVLNTFKSFMHNIYLNNLKNKIKTFNFGLSDTAGIKKMVSIKRKNYIQSGGYSFRINKFLQKDNIVENYNTKIGDKVLNFKNKILFIKMDVEGYELNVLKGIKNLLKKNKVFIQIEIFNKNFKTVNDFLKKNNFLYVKNIKDKSLVSDYYYKNFT
jgi:FkbM family methyltransferase